MKNPLAQKIEVGSLIKFALPTILTLAFLNFYQMTDGILVARFIGTDALSGLNIVFPIVSFFLAVAIMMATGGSALVSKELGEGNDDKARNDFTTIYILSVIIAIVLSIIIFLLREPVLNLLGVSERLYEHSHAYLTILICCITLAVLQVLAQYFLIAIGKPLLAFILVFLAGAANLFFDYFFMRVCGMGLDGAALASGFAFAIPGIFGVLYFTFNRKNSLYFTKPHLKLKTMIDTCFNGSSEMVSNLAIAVTTYMFNFEMLKHLNEEGVAAISIALYAQSLFCAVFFGYSCGVAPIISYNYGKKNSKNLRKIFKISIVTLSILSSLMFVATLVLSNSMVSIFSPAGTDVYEIASSGLRIFSFSFLLAGFNIFASNLYTALNNGLVSAVLAFTRTFVFIVLLLLILPSFFGVQGIWLAVPIGEFFSLIVSVIFIIRLRRKYKYM